jgi:hypothetical protein
LRCKTSLWTKANSCLTTPTHDVHSHINLLFAGW